MNKFISTFHRPQTLFHFCRVFQFPNHARPAVKPAIYGGYRVRREANGLLNLVKAYTRSRFTMTASRHPRKGNNVENWTELSQVCHSIRSNCPPGTNQWIDTNRKSPNPPIFSPTLLNLITTHLVAIGYRLPVGHRKITTRHLCGGFYLQPGWILTAAHCLIPFQSKRSKRMLRVSTYTTKRSFIFRQKFDNDRVDGDNPDCGICHGEYRPTGAEFAVEQIVTHPEYRRDNKLSVDLALARIHASYDATDTSVESDLSIIPISQKATTDSMDIDNSHSFGQPCVVAGSGRLEYGHINYKHEDQYLHIAKVTKAQCKSLLDQFGSSFDRAPGCNQNCSSRLNFELDHICAGGELQDGDTCQGDSGGPLFCSIQTEQNHTDESKEEWQLVGVASVGIGCGLYGVPSVYVKLANQRQWLTQVLNQTRVHLSPPPVKTRSGLSLLTMT